jgi:phage terminase large subunit-like protein
MMDLPSSSKNNAIREYYSQITSGQVTVSKKVRATMDHLIYQLDHPGRYIYDEAKAKKIISFAETYCHYSKGKLGGQLVKLMLWQKVILTAAFGFINKDTGLRKYRELILIIGRKNAKSFLSSIIAAYMLLADGENGPEIYSAATKRDQAKIIWEETKRMIKKSPSLRKVTKCLVGEIDCKYNDGVFKPLSSDSNSLDGLNVSASFIDELHAIQDINMYNVIIDGMSARQQPLSIITSTAGTVREGIFDLKYDECTRIIKGYTDNTYTDESVLPFIYELDDRDEIYDEALWIKANPGIDVIKDRTALQQKLYRAKSDPRLLKNLLCKDFNIRETSVSSYFDAKDIANESTFNFAELKPKYFVGGFDLSCTVDLTCTSALFKLAGDERLYLLQQYFMPEDLLEQHILLDKAPYDIWVDRGLLTLCPGNRIDQKMILNWFKELQQKYNCYAFKIGYDSWSAAYLVQDMANWFGKDTMLAVPQTKKVLSLPMQSFKALMQKNLINYNNNPMFKMCCINTEADTDVNGNIQPSKNRNKAVRIDGFTSGLIAYAAYLAEKENYDNQINY